MAFEISDEHLIPVERGHAVSAGWPSATGGKPHGVTWHWTATWDLKTCTRILGGANALRKGSASAHYGVGRSYKEGVDRYVTLENRSWHAGKGQTLRFDGKERGGSAWSGARTTIGIETVNIGYARKGVPAARDWIEVLDHRGRSEMEIQPWTDEQITMMIGVGQEIIERFPHIRPEHHHGHHDICPSRKLDVLGFPFAEVLRGIYDDPSIPDVWTPFLSAEQRQQALLKLGYDLGGYGADGDWGRMSQAALEQFQEDEGIAEDGMWSTFVCRAIYNKLQG